MKINGEMINTAVRVIRGNVRRIESPIVSNPLVRTPVQEVLIKEAPILRTPLTKKEIVNMKPSEFNDLLSSRTDISTEFTASSWGKSLLNTPEHLSLYDEINNCLLLKNIDKTTREDFLYNILKCSPDNVEYIKKVLPKLINKGYNIELLSQLRITEHNYKYIETVLKQQDAWQAKINTLISNTIKANIQQAKHMYQRELSQAELEKIANYEKSKEKEYLYTLISRICREVNKDNVKYLKDWSIYVDSIPFNASIRGIGQIKTQLLTYWNKDSLKILKEFLSVEDVIHAQELLEVISRRKHDYNFLKQIFGNNKIQGQGYRLLEFKNIDKYRNISLDNFNTLTTQEKKEFINSFISATSIKNILYQRENGLDVLKANLKMYEHIDTASQETIKKTYSETLKKMLESIPVSERGIIQGKANWGVFSKSYREQNPIPSLVDDIEKLPVRYEIINGKKYPVSEITNNTELAVSGHITHGDAFLNIQALEITDRNMILCVGTKGQGRKVHYSKDGYAVALKPRQGHDFWMQASHDIDSGNNATKNVVNVGNMFKGLNTHYSYIPDLIKKELNLSQREYTARMSKLKYCTTLDEIGKIDEEMEDAIRRVLANNKMFEGILRPTPMGVMIPYEMPADKINQNVLDYIDLRGIRLIRVKDVTSKADEARRIKAADNFIKTL